MKMFINSSEIYLLSYLSTNGCVPTQEQLAKSIGCSQANISIAYKNLIEKELIQCFNGTEVINYYNLIQSLVDYAKKTYCIEIVYNKNILKIKNHSFEVITFFRTYFRLFNINYYDIEAYQPQEHCFVFTPEIINIDDIGRSFDSICDFEYVDPIDNLFYLKE